MVGWLDRSVCLFNRFTHASNYTIVCHHTHRSWRSQAWNLLWSCSQDCRGILSLGPNFTIITRPLILSLIWHQNFLALCASGYYNNSLFHRNIPGFMVQVKRQMSAIRPKVAFTKSSGTIRQAILQEQVKVVTLFGVESLTTKSDLH